MSHNSVLEFGQRVITPELVKGCRVLEVGAYDINGSLRPHVEKLCKEYIGVDIELGPKVDKVVKAENLVKEFGVSSFDLVIAMEMLEHAADWRTCVEQIKQVSADYILITTRSEGFPYHGFPDDNWRYSIEDMEAIFADCKIISLEKDPEYDGVMGLFKKDLRKNPVALDLIEVTPAPDRPVWY